jgi:hypothetical protein
MKKVYQTTGLQKARAELARVGSMTPLQKADAMESAIDALEAELGLSDVLNKATGSTNLRATMDRLDAAIANIMKQDLLRAEQEQRQKDSRR